MRSFLSKEFFLHPIIVSAVGIVLVLAAGSGIYYLRATSTPASTLSFATTTRSLITGSGVVEPSQNPDLAFQSPGRIARIEVAVGQHVSTGQILAELNTADLYAQVKQAQANVAIQEAKLDGLRAGSRPEDVASSQASLDKAKQDLANMYASIGDTSVDSYTKASDAARVQLDQLFSNGGGDAPKLTYATADSQAKIDAEAQRAAVNATLNTWLGEVSQSGQSDSALDLSLQKDLSYLSSIRQLLENVSLTLESASSLSASTLASYKANVTVAMGAINTATKNLNTISQNIASETLTISQLDAQLALKKAGATKEDIQAQEAQVESAQAAAQSTQARLANAEIVAPFSGVVTSVHEKVGDNADPNIPVISLTPESPLQITVYLSEVDIAKISLGDSADVTMDAYGTSRHWAAAVVSIDHSPTVHGTTSGYKTVLQFSNPDPSISSGMTANISIPTVASNI